MTKGIEDKCSDLTSDMYQEARLITGTEDRGWGAGGSLRGPLDWPPSHFIFATGLWRIGLTIRLYPCLETNKA